MFVARISSLGVATFLLTSLASAQLPQITYTAETNVGAFAIARLLST